MMELSRQRLVAVAFAMLTILLVIAFVDGHTPRMDNSEGFLFDPQHTHFAIPMSLSVGLLGFSADGAQQLTLKGSDIQRTLEQAMPTYSPASVALKQSSGIQYHLAYSPQHLDTKLLNRVESVIRDNMRSIGQTSDGITIFDVDAAPVEKLIDEIYRKSFTQRELTPEEATSTIGMIKDRDAMPLAVILLNPDKIRMNPLKNKPYIYRYRYDDGAPTQQWIAARRYVFVDLGAGPITYGASDAGEGAVSIGSVPIVDVRQVDIGKSAADQPLNVATPKFLSEMTSLIISCVHHVFLPDVHWRHIKYAEKLILPVVVFRNHRRFHPLDQHGSNQPLEPGVAGPSLNDLKIDLDVIKREARKMLLPEQELMVVHGAHHLHDHRHISAAVFRALKQDSISPTTSVVGHVDLSSQPYLDSKMLLEELEHAADEVVSGLMLAEASGSDEDGLPTVPVSSSLPSGSARPFGHHVLPVFVLSLLGLPEGVLLDGKHLSVASDRCVLVLQTAGRPTPVPFFTDGSLLRLSPRSVTRHIVSGVALALGGVGDPSERWSVDGGRADIKYLWATGATPFGAFSSSSTLSLLLADSLVRNSITSRVSTTLRAVRRSLQRMKHFQKEYLEEAPTTEVVTIPGTSPSSASSASASAAAAAATRSPFRGHDSSAQMAGVARVVSERLASQMSDLENQLLHLAALVGSHQWSQSHALSGNILTTARAFEKYVASEIYEARTQLDCCRKVYAAPSAGLGVFNAVLSFIAIFSFAVALYWGLRSKIPGAGTKGHGGGWRNTEQLRPTLGALAASKPRTW